MIAKKYKVVYSSSILYDVPSLKEEEGKIEIDQKNYIVSKTLLAILSNGPVTETLASPANYTEFLSI